MHWPDHLLTLADWDALPEDNSRSYELVEGVLIVSPRPLALHQRAIWRLAGQLESQLPEKLGALPEVELIVDAKAPPTVRIPDLIVVPTTEIEGNPARWDADDVLLAVEILSDGSRRTDRVTKFAEYAEIGIQCYWLIDIEPPVHLTAYELVDDHYELVADSTNHVTLDLSGTPVTVDLASLTSARAR
ncbi:Uma2 family endonuclease [Nocardia cyriacigeorgica]|uniref:Uma2 family endonuclease n=2 Tax=Nocardia cyriacigeorgica TaxID=135487 RepID=A0A5R8NFR5_9NOCA|nr:Uma2 family endonuclease [Nocardia cyriacigeorgica]